MFFFFPVRINRLISHFPFVTVVLVAMNVLAFILSLAYLTNITAGLSPQQTAKAIEQFFQLVGFTLSFRGFYTWFTSLFIHGGIFHLLGNMVFLWLFGAALEDILGKTRFIFLYLSGGIVAALTHAVIIAIFVPKMTNLPLVGASGAIGALLGLFMIRFRRSQISIAYFFWYFIHPPIYGTFEVTSLVGLSVWLGWQVVSGLLQIGTKAGGVAYWAHIGGFVFGMIIAKVIRLDVAQEKEEVFEKAKDLVQEGDLQGAVRSYEKIIETQDKDPETLIEFARTLAVSDQRDKGKDSFMEGISLLLRQNKLDQALEVYEELGGLYSDVALDTRDQFRLASRAKELGRFELALMAFQTVVDTYLNTPQAEMALLRIGQTYLAMGDREQARQALADFLAKYPQSEWKNVAEDLLKKCGSAKGGDYLT